MTIKIKIDLAAKSAAKTIQAITYTAVTGGVAGNLITIEYRDPLAISQTLSISVVGDAIVVNMATNGAGMVISTADEIKAAIDLSGPAIALITAVVTGAGAALQGATAAISLKGGKPVATYDKGSPFYGINPKAAIVSISTGKIAEGWVKILSSGRSDPDGVKDGTSSLKIGRTGLEMTDVQFHYIINSSESFMTFGVQIVSLVEMGHIEVSQNGTPLTVAQIRAFTA